MHRSLSTLAIASILSFGACNYDKGTIEGTIEYVDSSWDPAGEPVAVPGVLVHVMAGEVIRGREILDGFEPIVIAGVPGGQLPTLVEYIQAHQVDDGEMLEAVQVDQEGRFSFEKIPRGSYLLFADYTSDLGYFAWLQVIEVQGTRTTIVDLSFDNRLPIVMPLSIEPTSDPLPELKTFEPETPPPAIEVEISADDKEAVEKLQKLGGEVVTP